MGKKIRIKFEKTFRSTVLIRIWIGTVDRDCGSGLWMGTVDGHCASALCIRTVHPHCAYALCIRTVHPHCGSGLICLVSALQVSCFTSNFQTLMKNEHSNIQQQTAVLTSWAASIEKSVAGIMAAKRSDILHNQLELISNNSKHTEINIVVYCMHHNNSLHTTSANITVYFLFVRNQRVINYCACRLHSVSVSCSCV